MADLELDPFHRQYRELSHEEKRHIDALKAHAGALYEGLLYANMPRPGCDPRALALARTKLEECVFWAVKAITS